jgi:hypothetical protein
MPQVHKSMNRRELSLPDELHCDNCEEILDTNVSVKVILKRMNTVRFEKLKGRINMFMKGLIKKNIR